MTTKVLLSNRIYIQNPSPELTKRIVTELTYKIKQNRPGLGFSPVTTIKSYKTHNGGKLISVPFGRSDFIPEGAEIVDKRVQYAVPFPDPKFKLRDDQQVVYDEVNDTAFINALVGWGKTFTALYLAYKFEQRTLVIVHTSALLHQWVDEVKNLFGIEPGIIGGGKLDYEDHPITIATIQSLRSRLDILKKEFGTIILDEAHHCPASTFSDILDAFYARYRIALSGTMIRKDQKHILFRDFFGNHVVKPAQSNTINPEVHCIKTTIGLNSDLAWADRVTDLTTNDNYIRFISGLALMKIEEGRSVLVIADRVEFLQKVTEYVGDSCVLVTGETSTEDRARAKEAVLSKEKTCIAGSRQIFSEGLSINILDCVILAVPISNDSLLEQIVGRVQRLHPGKTSAQVIDIQFAGRNDKKQNNDRLGFYLKKGWQIKRY